MNIKLTELVSKVFDIVACEGYTELQVLSMLQARTADVLQNSVYIHHDNSGERLEKIADLKWCRFAHVDPNFHQYKKQSSIYEQYDLIQSDLAIVTDPA